MFDSATPSGNAVAAAALARLAEHTGQKEYLEASRQTLEAMLGFMERMPAATENLLLAAGTYLDVAG